MISLTAGSTTVPVCLPSADQQRTFARLFADGGVSELTDPHDAFAGYAHDWPTPLAPRWVAPHLGRMHWPIVGASRYAHAVYLLHEADWFALAAEVETGATVTVAFEDGASAGETARTVGMKFLSAKPLVRLNEGQPVAADDEAGDAWFVVLVDQRYFAAREAIAGTGEASDGSGSSTAGNGGSARTFFSWSALFAALGVTVADAVDAAYGAPDRSRWTEARMRGRSAAVLADVAASLVGSRIVTVPGGSASLQRPTLARATALDTSVSTQADRIVWGGPIEAEASATECPDAVRAVFRAPSDSRVETLDSAATGYTAWPGNGPMGAALDPAVHETTATKQAVVDQWADDFCAWRFGMFAVTFAGVPTFPTSGFCWAVTIESKRDELLTRWERPPVMHGWLGRASVSAATNDQPAYPTRENGTETNGCDIPTGSGSGGDAVGLAWYSRYLHLGGVEVQAGQTLNPGQRIGVLMRNPPGTVAHLHHAVTDGGDPFLWPETSFPIAGVSLPIDDWLGFPVLGARVGLPNPRATRFDATQLAAIEARYRPPVEPNDRWRTFVSSVMHTLYDYYAVDLAFSDSTDAQELAGAPVFAAVGGRDVLTEVMWTGFRGSAGWGVLLRHRLCGAPDAGDTGDGMGALPPNGQWGDGGDFGADPHETSRGGLLEVVTRVCIGPITAGTLIGRDTEAGNGPMQEICVDPATLAIIDGVLTVTCCDGGGGGSGITELTGDVTAGPGSGAQAATLSSTGVSAGTYTSVTVDVKGRVTAGTNPTTLSGYGITDAQPLDADLTALAALTGTNTIYYRSAADTWSAVTIGSGLSFSGGTLAATGGSGTVTSVNLTAPAAGITVSGGPITTSGSITLALADDLAALEALSTTGLARRTGANAWTLDTSTYLTANQTITLSGDATGSGTTGIAVTLANSGVSAGTYQSVTVDAKGRVTAGTALNDVGLAPGGRLSASSTLPVSTTDLTPSTLYYLPYVHNQIPLWDGSKWVSSTVADSGVLLLLFGLTTNRPYDVFAYLSAGRVTLEYLAWTDDTTRATDVTLQDGRYCKSGDKTRLYLGTFYATGATTTEDSNRRRLIWNMYNRVPRRLLRQDSTTSWNYTTATWRSANNSTTNRVDVVVGIAGHSVIDLLVQACSSNSTASIARRVGIGVDSTTAPTTDGFAETTADAAGVIVGHTAGVRQATALGYHYYQWLEQSVATGTCTWYGLILTTVTVSGLYGTWQS